MTRLTLCGQQTGSVRCAVGAGAKTLIAFVTLFVLVSLPLIAQETPVATSDKAYPPQLSGTVVDTSGAVIAGATVQVRSANGTVQITTQSDANGSFIISGLSAGSYRLVVSKPGFESKEIARHRRDHRGAGPAAHLSGCGRREHHHKRAGPSG